MLGVNPVILLTKAPIPGPSSVNPIALSRVTSQVSAQTTPFAIMAFPLSPVTSPEHFADSCVGSVTNPISTIGKEPVVVKLFSVPYAMLWTFTAYAFT